MRNRTEEVAAGPIPGEVVDLRRQVVATEYQGMLAHLWWGIAWAAMVHRLPAMEAAVCSGSGSGGGECQWRRRPEDRRATLSEVGW